MLKTLTQQAYLRISPLVRTQARRRMVVIVATAVLFSLFTCGIDIILPLWVTGELGMDAGQWSHLRSLRMMGTLVGTILLGALSDRFGQRLLGALSMLGAGAVIILFVTRGQQGLWLGMPLLGALVSTAFVNLNTLTQQISDRRQGMANTIYRSTGAVVGIVAPLIVTAPLLISRGWGYAPAMVLVVVAIGISSAILFLYPGEATPPPLGNLWQETRRLGGGYLTALRERPLMAFILLSQIWGNLLAAVGIFGAIRFTRELGLTDTQFGLLAASGSVLGFLLVATTGFYVERIPLKRIHGIVGLLASASAILLGLSDLRWLSMIGFLACGPLTGMLAGPSSMWVSRTAGAGTPTAAFSVHKLIAAALVALAAYLLGIFEAKVGIRPLILYGGIAGLPLALLFFLLPEPSRPRYR